MGTEELRNWDHEVLDLNLV